MKFKSDTLIFVPILVAVVLLIAAMSRSYDQADAFDCDLEGYQEYPKQVTALVHGQKHTLEVMTMCLTKEQAKLMGNPKGVLRQARSYMVSRYIKDPLDRDADKFESCKDIEEDVNDFMLGILAQPVRDDLGTNSPVVICEHAKPVPTAKP